jgi:hypothetical protein
MKKITSLTLILLSCCYLAMAQSENISVKLEKGKFSINKAVITPAWDLSPAVKTLGNTDRLRNGFNITHTYDDLGIVLFEPKNTEKEPTGILSEFQAYFSAPTETSAVMPSGLFEGTITVENIRLSRNTAIADLRQKLLALKYAESDSYSPHNFRFNKDAVYFYVLFDETETRLVKFSIGKDTRGN